jgi:hypothetical protein
MSIGHIESSAEPGQALTDSNLVDAIRGGDRPALERLYLRYHPCLARLLAMCMATRHNIGDLIDETFLTRFRMFLARMQLRAAAVQAPSAPNSLDRLQPAR